MSEPRKDDELAHEQRRARRPAGAGTLRRSRNRIIAGVAGGIAEAIGRAPSTVRLLAVLLSILSGGIFVIIYALLALLLPAPTLQTR